MQKSRSPARNRGSNVRRPDAPASAAPRRAFTLIELLVVVAIVAILAAVAVPNFMEAQVRSKVSRARADLRTAATALEAYAVDNNAYPLNPRLNVGFYVLPPALTTPVAYLSTRPKDPFKARIDVGVEVDPKFAAEQEYYDYYRILSTEEYYRILADEGRNQFVLCIDASGPLADVANRGALEKYGRWLLWSIGPDGRFWIPEEDFINPTDSASGLRAPAYPPFGYSFDLPYDPTNGTRSFGNIIHSQKNPRGAMLYETP